MTALTTALEAITKLQQAEAAQAAESSSSKELNGGKTKKETLVVFDSDDEDD